MKTEWFTLSEEDSLMIVTGIIDFFSKSGLPRLTAKLSKQVLYTMIAGTDVDQLVAFTATIYSFWLLSGVADMWTGLVLLVTYFLSCAMVVYD